MKKTLGMDVGGSRIRFALLSNRLERSIRIDTPKNRTYFFNELDKVLRALPMKEISGIGIGIPGLVDRKSGKILVTPNLDFLNGVDLRQVLSKYKKKLAFENDVKCMMVSESKLGAARGKKNVVLIALGTGI